MPWLQVRHLLMVPLIDALPEEVAGQDVIIVPSRLTGEDWRILSDARPGEPGLALDVVDLLFGLAGLQGDGVVCHGAASGPARAFLAHARHRRAHCAALQQSVTINAHDLLPAGGVHPTRLGVLTPAMAQSVVYDLGFPADRVSVCGQKMPGDQTGEAVTPGMDALEIVRALLTDMLPDHEFKRWAPSGLPGVAKRFSRNLCIRYFGDGLKEILAAKDAIRAVMAPAGRVTFLTHESDTRFGLARPPWYYASAIASLGLRDVEILEIEPGADLTLLADHLLQSRFVIFNSIGVFSLATGIPSLVSSLGPGRCAIYLHETEYGLDSFKKHEEQQFDIFVQAIRHMPVLCASDRQRNMLQTVLAVRHARVCYYSTYPERASTLALRDPAPIAERRIRVAMAGTQQKRKGVTLFSETADRAAALGLDMEFEWIGASGPYTRDVYKSSNVRWYDCHLADQELFDYLRTVDVFLLSSFDDPFPLVVLDALQACCRILVFGRVGPAEIVNRVGGCAIYSQHEPDAVLSAMDTATGSAIDMDAYRLLSAIMSPACYIQRFEQVLDWVAQCDGQADACAPAA